MGRVKQKPTTTKNGSEINFSNGFFASVGPNFVNLFHQRIAHSDSICKMGRTLKFGANGYYQQPRVQMPSSSSGFTTRYFGYQPQLPYQHEKAAAASFLSQFMQPEESSMAKRDGVIRGFLVQRYNHSIESDS